MSGMEPLPLRALASPPLDLIDAAAAPPDPPAVETPARPGDPPAEAPAGAGPLLSPAMIAILVQVALPPAPLRAPSPAGRAVRRDPAPEDREDPDETGDMSEARQRAALFRQQADGPMQSPCASSD